MSYDGRMRVRSLIMTDVPALAAMHARAFPAAEAWSAASFAELLAAAGVAGWGAVNDTGDLVACLMVRAVADEAEILTLATAPSARRQGGARHLVGTFLGEATRANIHHVFLEVADDNLPAQALYAALGFRSAGRRPHYYPGDRTALVLRWCA